MSFIKCCNCKTNNARYPKEIKDTKVYGIMLLYLCRECQEVLKEDIKERYNLVHLKC